jgi:hypothetical protein
MANKVANALGGAASGAAAGTAILPGIGTAVGAIIGGVGGLFGGESESEKAAKAAVAELQEMGVPSEEARRIVYEKYQAVGELTPEIEQAISVDPTELQKVTTDPRFQQAQMQALANLENKAKQGGLDLSGQATLEGIKMDLAREARGKNAAIQQEMRQRGLGGSGSELAARLAATQASADQAGQQGLNLAALAQRQATENLGQMSNLARQMQQDELSRKSDAARAQDMIKQSNANLASGVQMRNVASKNRAQELDVGYQRNVAQLNTGLTNTQRESDRDARLGVMADQNAKRVAIANARIGAAAQADTASANRAKSWSDTLTSAGALGAKLFEDKDKKKA